MCLFITNNMYVTIGEFWQSHGSGIIEYDNVEGEKVKVESSLAVQVDTMPSACNRFEICRRSGKNY